VARSGAGGAARIDLGGRTIMPGLIDAHVHIFITKIPLAVLESMPLTQLAISAGLRLARSLHRPLSRETHL
jgi:imidazolonepropionase-like amidohydrolase